MDAVATSIRVAARFWSNVVTLARVPLEFVAAEDECLGVGETTVFFPGALTDPMPVVEGARLVGSNRPARLSIAPVDDPVAGRGVRGIRVKLELPQKLPFAICGFRLRDGTVHREYLQPFGVPGRRR
jgi:hypothetical protein